MSAPILPKLSQINASYNPVEDRIQLNIALSDESEFRFLVTRRMLPLLWQMLEKVVESCSQARTEIDPLLRESVAELVQMNALNNADFETAYKSGTNFPLGETPILVAKLTLKTDNPALPELSLLPEHGRGLTLNLDDNLTHIIANLLEQATSSAEWKLTLPPLTPLPGAAVGSGKHLH